MPEIFAPMLDPKTVWRSCGSFQKPPMHLKENQSLSQDFIDILSAFTDGRVEYILVDGYAMGFHGYARGTGDIDLWIRREERNADRVILALKMFGAPLFEVKSTDFLLEDTVFQIGLPPNRIDIITDIDAVSFDDAWPERVFVQVEGMEIPILDRSLLLVNKLATGRPKDQPDVLWLKSEENSQ